MLPPPILTAVVNLSFQKGMMPLFTDQFLQGAMGARDCIITQCITNHKAMLSYLISQNLWDFSFYLQSDKPTNAVIHQIPITTPVQDFAKVLKGLGLDIIRLKQISTKCLSCRRPLTSVKYKTTGLKLDWHSALTANIMAKYGSTGSSLLDVFGVGVAADMSNHNSYP